MEPRALYTVALVLVVALAGCPQGDGTERTIVPGDPTATPDATPTQPPTEDTSESSPLGWQIVRVTGGDLDEETVGTMTVIAANLSAGANLDIEDAVVLVNHDGDSYRFQHPSREGDSAAGQFSTGRIVTNTTLERNRYRRVVELRIDISASKLTLDADESAEVLVVSPNVTTTVVPIAVPRRLNREVGVILGSEFATEDRRPERREIGVPQLVSASATNVTDAGAGVVNLTVTKLPGSAPLDYRNVTLLWTGPGEAASFVHRSRNASAVDGHFGLTAVRDPDTSLPVLNDHRDRFRLTLDRGPNNTAVDDGPLGESVGTRLLPNTTARLQIVTDSGETRFFWVRVPEGATAGQVELDGVVPKDDTFPRTNQRPVLRVTSTDDQRVDNDTAVTGLGIGIRKPPTADPIDPRTLTVTVETPRGAFRLVHPSTNTTAADGHFGLDSQFNPDGSAPILDDHFDFAQLTVDFGADTNPDDNGPLGSSIGENVSVGSVVTVTVETAQGVAVQREYRVRG